MQLCLVRFAKKSAIRTGFSKFQKGDFQRIQHARRRNKNLLGMTVDASLGVPIGGKANGRFSSPRNSNNPFGHVLKKTYPIF